MTRRRISLFVEQGLSVDEGEAMREHVRKCLECRVAYQQTIRSAARLGRAQREERLDEQRQRRALFRKRVGVEADTKPRRGMLRLALLPALFALLVIQMNRLSSANESGIRVTRVRGEVYAAGRTLTEEDPSVVVGRAVACATREGAEAILERGDTRFVMGGETMLEVELDRPVPRLRFHAGILQAEGPCAISTAVGVVEQVDGRASLQWLGRTLEITCLTGSMALTDAQGHHEVREGERILRDLAGLAAP